MDAVKSVVSSPSLFRNVVIIVVAALVAYLIYYYTVRSVTGGKDSTRAHMIPVSKIINANNASSSVTAGTLDLSPWSTGGEYTLSAWIYINEWNVNAGSYRHVFSLESGGKMLLYGIIDREVPTLILRVCGQADNVNTTRTDLSKTGFTTMMTTPGDQRLASNNVMGPVGVAMCDIEDIDLQRWIFVTLAVRGRAVDVFMDGKLAKQCILPSLPAATPGSLILRVGAASAPSSTSGVASPPLPSFGGYISNMQTFSKALDPESIVDLYQAGPESPTGGWLSGLLRVFTVTVTFSNSDGSNAYTLKL